MCRVAGYPSRELVKRFDDFVFAFRRDGFELSEAVEIWILFQIRSRQRLRFHTVMRRYTFQLRRRIDLVGTELEML